jgi:hypothetical protein
MAALFSHAKPMGVYYSLLPCIRFSDSIMN